MQLTFILCLIAFSRTTMIDKDLLNEIDTFGTPNCYICPPESCRNLLSSTPKSINIIHLNIRSVNCNFDNFRVFLSSINIICDIIVLTECWLNASLLIPTLDGYRTYSTSKSRNKNDGVIIFVKDSLPHLILEPNMLDASCIICNLTNHNMSVIAIYRSPSIRDYGNFFNSLNDILISQSAHQNITIMGDINIDITPNNTTSQANDYLNLIASYGLYPSHSLPTRGNTCIDHIMVKTTLKTVTLVFDTYITDHRPTLINIETEIKSSINKLPRKSTNHAAVIAEIASINFDFVTTIQDADKAAQSLVSTIRAVINKHFKTIYVKSKNRILKPWITKGLLRCIRHRDSLARKVNQTPENYILKLTYIRYRNFCNKLLKKLKISFEKTELQKNKNNPKATWSTIKNITSTNLNHISSSDLLNILPDKTSSINFVNTYFANIGTSLIEKFNNRPYTVNLNSSVPSNSFVLLPTDEKEVREIIIDMRADAAMGWDGISSKILKSCLSTLLPVITHICNISMSTGCFPRVFKQAVVHPIFKNGDKKSVSNYRPISVLPAISKVLEKIINKRLIKYLESLNLLAPNQYGFRRGKSTEDAVSSLTNHVISKLDKKLKCLGIFIDISKAFDTVCTSHLLKTLETFGIRGHTHKIFENYLSDRTQCVKINDEISDLKPLNCGVPQGSILGPTLFLIYMNNLCKLSLPNCSIFSYADDTALIIHGTNWPETILNAEIALKSVLNWLSNNLLTINLTKTVFLPFSLQSSSSPTINSLVLKAHTCSNIPHSSACDCTPLPRTNVTKYLGIYIDSFINWKPHIDILTLRIRKLIYILKTLRRSADFTTLKIVYFALCQSIISYCITTWGGASKTHILKLERAQRAVLKVMTFRHFRYPTKAIYQDCQVLSVRQLYIYNTILRKHSSLPYNTSILNKRRFYSVCPTPSFNTALAKRHFHVLSSQLYNKANKQCNIYPLSRYLCKNSLYKWLQSKNYDETEKLINNIN